MSDLTEDDKGALLRLARSAIQSELTAGVKVAHPVNPSRVLEEKRGCFVTLHKAGKLRGCIGTIEPTRSLVANVEANALNAAFRDHRFKQLKKDELPGIELEISVLTRPVRLHFRDGEDLKGQLKPGVHGVILTNKGRRSTFLPQVWEQLPDKETFLQQLCLKGQMGGNCWRDTQTVVEVYEAEYFSEQDHQGSST